MPLTAANRHSPNAGFCCSPLWKLFVFYFTAINFSGKIRRANRRRAFRYTFNFLANESNKFQKLSLSALCIVCGKCRSGMLKIVQHFFFFIWFELKNIHFEKKLNCLTDAEYFRSPNRCARPFIMSHTPSSSCRPYGDASSRHTHHAHQPCLGQT